MKTIGCRTFKNIQHAGNVQLSSQEFPKPLLKPQKTVKKDLENRRRKRTENKKL